MQYHISTESSACLKSSYRKTSQVGTIGLENECRRIRKGEGENKSKTLGWKHFDKRCVNASQTQVVSGCIVLSFLVLADWGRGTFLEDGIFYTYRFPSS